MSTDARRIAAIMLTDVVGHMRLMAEDQPRALAMLQELRLILEPLIAGARGTLHREAEDATLSSFASAVDAVDCACAIQRSLRDRTTIELRIGLHIGEVLLEGDDVHGDGVSVVARIEPLAPPGGLALSDTVRTQLRGRRDLPMRSLGQPLLKGGLPVEIFVCDLAADADEPVGSSPASRRMAALWARLRANRLLQWTLAWIALAFGMLQGVVLLVDLFGAPPLIARLAAIVLAWSVPAVAVLAWFHGTPGRQQAARREFALLGGLAALAVLTVALQIAQAPPVPMNPAVAQAAQPVVARAPNSMVVLPFENQSGRPEDAYLSEGFGDELRDQLSRVPGLRVVARGSSIAFRDAQIEAQEIAARLAVANVIEGSLRKQGEQLRIAVRLVDGVTGMQRWSESYDRSSASLLIVQQEIALAAARAILPQVSLEDIPKPQWQASVNELMLLARNYQQTAVRPQDQERVIELYRQVLAQDPQSAIAHARLGQAMLLRGTDPEAAEQHLRRALALDPELAEGHANLGFMLWSQFRKGSGELFQRAYELNPNDVNVLRLYAQFIGFQGPREPARQSLLRARELDPMSLLANADLAGFLATTGSTDETAAAMALIDQRFPTAAGRQALARIADTAGELDEAIAWAHEALRLDPGREDATRDLAERYARFGMLAESRRLQPEPSLRVLFWERRYQDIVTGMQSVDIDEADADSLGYLAFALQALGRDGEAVPLLQGMGLPDIALDGELRRWAALHHLATLIGSLSATGDTQQARRLALRLDELSERTKAAGERGWAIPFWSACARMTLGKRDLALDAFERAAAAPNLAWLPLLQDGSCFRELRGDTRYQQALLGLEQRHAELRQKLPATLSRHGLTAITD